MYLSKLVLDPTSYRVQKDLGNPYQLHRTIMKAFPDNLKENNSNGRILFRINKNGNKRYPSVLIQSLLCPDWSYLINNGDYLLEDPVFKQFNYPNFTKGAKFWFRLFGNPTKKVNGKRIGMYKEDEQYNWLQRKGKQGGFRLFHVSINRKEEVRAKANKNSKKITLYGVQFEGVLQVVDSKKFETSMLNGIGSGKAFGLGFLTISKF